MEKIVAIADSLLEECKKENVSVMVAYGGKDKTRLFEWNTLSDKAPDRIKRARSAFMNAPVQTGHMEFDD
ncbi:hypothetical protein [Anaerospora hongkongensis]|uniref:hypothetical protein n=1 Tax=Anaerospora hongkongensis TaxID=244830 RepID=UPI002FD91FCC